MPLGVVARIARRHASLDLLRAFCETGPLLLRARPLARLRPEIALALGDLARLVAQRVTRGFGLREGRRRCRQLLDALLQPFPVLDN